MVLLKVEGEPHASQMALLTAILHSNVVWLLTYVCTLYVFPMCGYNANYITCTVFEETLTET